MKIFMCLTSSQMGFGQIWLIWAERYLKLRTGVRLFSIIVCFTLTPRDREVREKDIWYVPYDSMKYKIAVLETLIVMQVRS